MVTLGGVPHEGESCDRPSLRRDAERNRQRILEAAGRLIGERGLDISHDEIAREAHVGVATVYRRFPTCEQLFDAVYDRQLEAMVEVADEAARIDDPWQALEFFLVRTFEEQAANRGLRELLIGHGGGSALARRAQAQIGPVVGKMVARAQLAGSLNPAIGATDMAMIPVMINAVMHASRDVDPQLWRRWVAIILEGMGTGPRRRELPGASPTSDEVAQLIGGNAGTRRRRG